MTQHLVQHKTSIRFNPRNRGMMTLLLACAMLSSTASWAVDPTVKKLRIGFQKSSINFAIALVLLIPFSSSCILVPLHKI